MGRPKKERPKKSMGDNEKIKRQALFVPCTSKEHLKRWIKVYLGINVPDCTVCDDDTTNPPSNSNPMDLIWEIYNKALEGNDEKFQTVLAYAARDSFKTLSASIIEVLCLFHLRRSVAHMAALESQAVKCIQYVEGFLSKPILRDYVTSNSKRTLTITRYDTDASKTISPKEYADLDATEQFHYTPSSYYVQVIIATLKGANSAHTPFMVLDELDLAPAKPIEEAQMIPCQGERGELPITLMISSRKFAFGLVQKAIDEAIQTNTVIRHWNLIDVARSCPPTRHLPNIPKIPIYYNETTLQSISEEEYKLLATEVQAKFVVQEGYTGCLRNCSLFAMCKGRLATKQKSDSNLCKIIPSITGLFSKVTPDTAKAQLLCWKPSSEGLVYPYFTPQRHTLRARDMAELITGDTIKDKDFNKAKLIRLMIDRGMTFHMGMDFGYTHNFAVVLGGLDGNRLFVFEVIAQAGLELTQRVELCKPYLMFDATVYPDPAYPADIKTFRRNGFRCKAFTKDIMGGIEAIRTKLTPGLNKPPELYLLAGDKGCELLAQRISTYHWLIDAAGKVTDVPDDEHDDEVDALRYLCQNLFGVRSKPLVAAVNNTNVTLNSDGQIVQNPNNWLTDKINELTDGNRGGITLRGKKGSFIFEM